MSLFCLLFGQDNKEIKSFSTICQGNGQWHLPLPECHSMLAESKKKVSENIILSIVLLSTDILFCSFVVIDCGEPEPLLNGGVTFLSDLRNQYLSVVEYQCNKPFYTSPGDRNGKILTYCHTDLSVF